ncbi:hypothetical protein V2J09_007611 [Rumex salicifolius]
MEKQEELQWNEAQQITVNVNLINSAKQQLRFLAAVDKNRCLYEGPTLKYAVSRYKYCWLPLLAKQAELGVFPLVAPFDCEWLRYKADCEELYGRVLDSLNVMSSSVDGASTTQTEEIWKTLYPNEPYLIDLKCPFDEDDSAIAAKFSDSKTTSYDLISAVKRQSTFFYQVSRPHMSNEEYLKASVERYKGFLHLIRKNMKSNKVNSFCVPTYDIDLIWHSHQLHPAAYCQDTMAVFGKVLDHDDTDSDRGEGKKLNVGFDDTTRQWEETFGLSYGRAGARYKGPAPIPLMVDSFISSKEAKKMNKRSQYILKLPKMFLVEVLMEIVGIGILPRNPGEKLYILLSKKEEIKQTLKIPFDSEMKEVVGFHCDPNGILIFELVSKLENSKAKEILGTACLSLTEGRLSEDHFLELIPPSGIASKNPMTLHLSLSLTPPFPAPYMLYFSPFTRAIENPRILIPQNKIQLMNGSWMYVTDKAGNFAVCIKVNGNKKEVIGISGTGKAQILAESEGSGWSLLDSEWNLYPSNKRSNQGRLKLEYETQSFGKRPNEEGYMTAVEFSSEDPNGRAIALIDYKACAFEIKEEWFLLPGIISACVLSTTMEDLNIGGNDTTTRKECKHESLQANDLMAHCMGSGCGGGSCGGGCGGGCRSGGCQAKCSGTCGS